MTVVHDNLEKTEAKMRAKDVSVYYGAKKAIDDVSIDIPTEYVTAFIGPSGCGKSTFLRTLNRMNDTIPSARVEGSIELDGDDIYSSGRTAAPRFRAVSSSACASPAPLRSIPK